MGPLKRIVRFRCVIFTIRSALNGIYLLRGLYLHQNPSADRFQMKFDPTAALTKLEHFWSLRSEFGLERDPYHIYLDEIISDRFALVNGLQLLRDELQFAGKQHHEGDMAACAVDLSVPSVCTTVACTNCGDRIHQGDTESAYRRVVASRFATLSEVGELKVESFAPTGGGTDDGATLAHVTVAHQLDDPLRNAIYSGHPQSFVLATFDLRTHVGKMVRSDGSFEFGMARESRWREPRPACGAIVGTLRAYNPANPVHQRLRRDLGEENFAYLANNAVISDDGYDVTAAVAASIIAIQGMKNTAAALTQELDERGMGHLTASTTINRVSDHDTLLYLARATVFGGTVRTQGFGTDARKYSAQIVRHSDNDLRLKLSYDATSGKHFPAVESTYGIRHWQPAS